MLKKNQLVRGLFSLAIFGAAGVANAAFFPVTVEFSEAGLPTGTPLAGSNAFAPEGLHFDGSAQLAVDSRFNSAGTDNVGITTASALGPLMGVLFDDHATDVTFAALSVNTDFYATAYDSLGTVLDTYFIAANGSTSYFSHTFSGVGEIAKIEFHDNSNFIGVGRITYTPVPEPTSLAAIACAGLLAMRRRGRGC